MLGVSDMGRLQPAAYKQSDNASGICRSTHVRDSLSQLTLNK